MRAAHWILYVGACGVGIAAAGLFVASISYGYWFGIVSMPMTVAICVLAFLLHPPSECLGQRP